MPMGQLIRRAIGSGPIPKIVTSGDRSRAVKAFAKGKGTEANSLLLIDSEGENLNQLTSWVLSSTNLASGANGIFFMVGLMEAWFLADRRSLTAYYGQGLLAARLPGNPDIEAIPPRDVLRGLRDATRRSPKGAYDKGKHAPRLLAELDPSAVYKSCPNFARLIDSLN